MVFHSQEFILVFLPIVLCFFYGLRDRRDLREWVLVGASVVFYGWWDIRFVPLLLGQTLATWMVAKFYLLRPGPWPVTAGVAANLAVLAFFKYANFFLDTLAVLVPWDLPRSDVVLPIGISFFTFQLISYLVDLRRGEIKDNGLREFCLFVFFFPQLVAGPIVRNTEIVPQLALSPSRPGWAERAAKGATLFVIGMAKKVLIADKLAMIADPVFAKAVAGGPLGTGEAWYGSGAFALQLYFDFSAYTDMAIGLGLLFGIVLPANFNAPYHATSIKDFWRRWHMTLSRFLRDYVYIPLGGSRNGPVLYVMATMVTMTLCGLWHGAAWTFVAWGMMHGLGLLICTFWQRLNIPLPAPAGWLLTMVFVLVGWVIFRSPDFGTAGVVLAAMAGFGVETGFDPPRLTLMILAATLALALPTSLDFVQRRLPAWRAAGLAFAALAVVCVLEVGKGQPVTFIYFQF